MKIIKNKQASILLWAIMLSLIISISFITISSKINKNIKNSGNIKKFIEKQEKINKFSKSYTSSKIDDNTMLLFDNNKEKIFSLLKNQENILSFSGTNNFNINIIKLKGGELYYKYKFDGNTTSSGIVNSNSSFSGKLDSSTKKGKLIIKNLSGYSQFLIKSENEFEENIKKYKIITKIGNISINAQKGSTN